MTTEGKLIVLRGGPLSGCATVGSTDYWSPPTSETFQGDTTVPLYSDSGRTEIWQGEIARIFDWIGYENASTAARVEFRRVTHKKLCEEIKTKGIKRTLWEF